MTTALAEIDPFSPSTPDEATELAALARSLQLALGFELLFVICDGPARRRDLRNELRARLSQLRFLEIELNRDTSHLLDELKTQLAESSDAADVIFVDGIERAFPEGMGGDRGAIHPWVANLNATRNAFRDALMRPLVLWLPTFAFRAIATGAVDFSSIRSGAFYFAAATEAALDRASTPWHLYGMTPPERQELLREIEGRLSEAAALPSTPRHRLAEARLQEQLGRLLLAQGALPEAQQAFERAFALRTEALGSETHRDVAATLTELARVLRARGDLAAARMRLERALAIQSSLAGHESQPDVAAALHELAWVQRAQGDLAGAQTNLEQALSIKQATLGERHPEIAVSLNDLAGVLRGRGQFSEALQAIERAQAIEAAAFGDEPHLTTAATLHELAGIRLAQGHAPEARANLERALAIKKQVFGTESHPEVADTLHVLATVLKAQGDLAGARKALEQVQTIDAQVYGATEHYMSALTERELALVQIESGERDAGLDRLQNALGVLDRNLGAEHPFAQRTRATVERLAR